jgi:hypothetical protein
MNEVYKTELWGQFGAALDMFENALVKCPEQLWEEESKFWYIAYHTLFFTDYYLTEEPDKFQPPAPYTLSEFDEEGTMPERTYSKDELISYTHHCREKCRKLLGSLTDEMAASQWKDKYRDYTLYKLLLYNMRHVQHHTGQLNLLLGKIDHELPKWVSQTKVEL